MQDANQGLEEALLRVQLPESSALAKMADHFLVPQSDLQKMLQNVVGKPTNSSLLAKELSKFRSLSVQQEKGVRELFIHAAEVMHECGDGAERLAKSGWTLPVHMSPGQMVRVLRKKTENEIDEEFIAFYHEDGQFQRLKSALLGSPRLQAWDPLLGQCFENYEAAKHVICIPALLSMLEGAIALSDSAAFVRVQERVAFFKNKIQLSSTGSVKELMWKTLDAFISRLYGCSDFKTGAPPSRPNRHWILHGRDLPTQWSSADALRLFHALSTLCSVCD
jgi:hypothetical protein